jgi:hypothetical protein
MRAIEENSRRALTPMVPPRSTALVATPPAAPPSSVVAAAVPHHQHRMAWGRVPALGGAGPRRGVSGVTVLPIYLC